MIRCDVAFSQRETTLHPRLISSDSVLSSPAVLTHGRDGEGAEDTDDGEREMEVIVLQ